MVLGQIYAAGLNTTYPKGFPGIGLYSLGEWDYMAHAGSTMLNLVWLLVFQCIKIMGHNSYT